MAEITGNTPSRVHLDLDPFTGVDENLAAKYKDANPLKNLFTQVRSHFATSAFSGREAEFQKLQQQYSTTPKLLAANVARKAVLQATPKHPIPDGCFTAIENRGVFFSQLFKGQLPNLERASDSAVKLWQIQSSIPIPAPTVEPRTQFETEIDGVDLHIEELAETFGNELTARDKIIRMTQPEEVVALYDDSRQLGSQMGKKIFASTITGVALTQICKKSGQLAMTSPILPLKIVGAGVFLSSMLAGLMVPYDVASQLDRHNETISTAHSAVMKIIPDSSTSSGIDQVD